MEAIKRISVAALAFVVLTTAGGCANGSGGVQMSGYDGQQVIEVFSNKALDGKLLKNIGVNASTSGQTLDLSMSASVLLKELTE